MMRDGSRAVDNEAASCIAGEHRSPSADTALASIPVAQQERSDCRC